MERLKNANFSNNDISVLFPDKETTLDFATRNTPRRPKALPPGQAPGGVVGGALGWLAGIGALAIPGVGPFIAAGPILAALSGAAAGATAGGIVGGLIGLGIPEPGAKRYESKIKQGNLLLPSTPKIRMRSTGRKPFSNKREPKTFDDGRIHSAEEGRQGLRGRELDAP